MDHIYIIAGSCHPYNANMMGRYPDSFDQSFLLIIAEALERSRPLFKDILTCPGSMQKHHIKGIHVKSFKSCVYMAFSFVIINGRSFCSNDQFLRPAFFCQTDMIICLVNMRCIEKRDPSLEGLSDYLCAFFR